MGGPNHPPSTHLYLLDFYIESNKKNSRDSRNTRSRPGKSYKRCKRRLQIFYMSFVLMSLVLMAHVLMSIVFMSLVLMSLMLMLPMLLLLKLMSLRLTPLVHILLVLIPYPTFPMYTGTCAPAHWVKACLESTNTGLGNKIAQSS